MKNKRLKLSFLTAILLFVFGFTSSADAQTKRRKRTASPPPSVPVVVSQSDVYLDGNQIVLGENPPVQTTAEPVVPEPANTTGESGEVNSSIKELNARIRSLESNKQNQYDEKQKRLLLNLDILSRSESRAESLRKQLFEMIEKENTVKSRLEQIQFDSRSEVVDRAVAMVGSLRPEEIRDQRRKSLEAEKRNLESLLTQIQTSRATLESSVERADFLVEKVRLKLDKEIDDALAAEEEKP
jgi:TolA-binding protein